MNNTLKRVNFADRYNEVQPSTFSGKALKEAHIRRLGAAELTYLGLSNIINECLSSKDEALSSFAEGVVRQINESSEAQFRVSMLNEMATAAAKNTPLLNTLVQRLDVLLEMDETSLTEALQHGALAEFATVYQPARMLHEHYNQNTPKLTDTHTVYVPVSYVEMNEGKTYFVVEDRPLMVTSDGKVVASDGKHSPEFMPINEAIGRMPYDPVKKEFFAKTLIGNASIDSEGNLFVNELPTSMESFTEAMNEAVTNANMSQANIGAQIKIADDIVTLYENFSNFMELDRVRVAKSDQLNESVALIVMNGASYLVESAQYGKKSFTKAETLVEGLNKFESRTHCSLFEAFSEDVSAEVALFEAAQQTEREKSEAIALVESEIAQCDPGSERHDELTEILNTLKA